MTSAPAPPNTIHDHDRLQRERAFHDQAYADHKTRASAERFYAVTGASRRAYAAALEVPAGAEVLEYGCGEGSAAFELAARGADVTGIDISPVAIETARAEASAARLEDRLHFEVMDAEALALEDASFDVVCGSGILHHLDLAKALNEIARVLKPTGKAVFVEPLGHNPLINLYRRRTPSMRTADEHPLVAMDFELARGRFGRVDLRSFHLASLAAVPAQNRKGFQRLVAAADAVDRALFRSAALRMQAWTVLLELSCPRPVQRTTR